MRASVAAVIVIVGMVAPAPIAGADHVADLAARGADAVFSGEQSVVCDTPDGRQSAVFEVGQANGVMVTRDAGDVVRMTRVVDRLELAPGYRMVDRGERRILGRPVAVVDVLRDDAVRLILRFDVETGVVLSSDVFDGDGTRYCSTRYLSFEPGDAGIADGARLPQTLGETASFNDAAFPAEVAGFDRMSVTRGPDDEITTAHYTDGVFSFTVLNARRVIEIPELADAPAVQIGDGEYLRRFDLGTAVISWSSDQGGLVVVGDLPVDLQTQVLAELPAPRRPGLFERLWRGLFN